MLERPEFVLHSQVTIFEIDLRLPLMVSLVGCSVCHFLTLPLESGIRRDIFRSDSPLGHEIEASARLEDTFVCGWSYPPRLRDADGRYPECPQLDHEQHRRAGLQLVGRHVGSTPGISSDFRLFHLFRFLRRDRNPWNSSTLATTKPERWPSPHSISQTTKRRLSWSVQKKATFTKHTGMIVLVRKLV